MSDDDPVPSSGIVKWFDGERGYGFITPDDGGSDVFVHFSGIDGSGPGRKNLLADQRVTYDVEPGRDDRPQAVRVSPLG